MPMETTITRCLTRAKTQQSDVPAVTSRFHPPLATPVVASVVPVKAAPAIISPASSPTNANITNLDGPADANRYDSKVRENDDSLMEDGGGGDDDNDEMGIYWENPHEDFQEAMI